MELEGLGIGAYTFRIMSSAESVLAFSHNVLLHT